MTYLNPTTGRRLWPPLHPTDKGTCGQHPGTVLLDTFMRPRGLLPADVAWLATLPVGWVVELVGGTRNVDPQMADRLARFAGTSPPPLFWLRLQRRYDDRGLSDSRSRHRKGQGHSPRGRMDATMSDNQTTDALPHPMQPVGWDDRGVIRFKRNAIVEHLVEECRRLGGTDLNRIAVMTACGEFPTEDHVQLAQLVGYSVGGFSDLSYAPPNLVRKADRAAEKLVANRGATDDEHRADARPDQR